MITNSSFFVFCFATGDSDSFIANRIQLNTNATRVVVGNGFVADALIYIQFPKGEFSAFPPTEFLGENNRIFEEGHCISKGYL